MRAVRASLVAVVAVGLGVAGHALVTDGRLPALWLVAALGAVIGLGAYAVCGRELRSGTLLLALLAGQIGVHAGAVLTAGVGNHALAGHPLSVATFFCGADAGSMTATHGHVAGAIAMVAMHLAASILCLWWMRAGERLAWRGLRAGALLVSRALGLPPGDVTCVPSGAPPRVAAPSHRSTLTASQRAGRAWSRRGPPLAFARA